MPSRDRAHGIENTGRGPLSTDELAAVIGHDIPAGSYVNLGIGQPTKIADYLPTDADGNPTVILHTENGMLGMGPAAAGDDDRPRPHQRGQGPGDRAARRVVLPPRRLVRDDARRPPRRLRPRRLPGRGQRRPRQLAHRQAGGHPGRRRRHGPGDRRQGRLRDDDALHQEGRGQAGPDVHVPAHRRRLRQPRLHRLRHLRHPARRRARPRHLRHHAWPTSATGSTSSSSADLRPRHAGTGQRGPVPVIPNGLLCSAPASRVTAASAGRRALPPSRPGAGPPGWGCRRRRSRSC